MKLRKTRLAAVLMSALMVASTMSPYVYAEEEIILDEEYTIEAEGGEESVEDEADVLTVDAVEAVSDTVSVEVSTGNWEVDVDSITWYYDEANNYSLNVTYRGSNDDGATWQTMNATAYIAENGPKVENVGTLYCETAPWVVLAVKLVDEKVYNSDQLPTGEKAPGHKWAEVEGSRIVVKEGYDTSKSLVRLDRYCTVCGKEDKGYETYVDADAHVYGEVKYVVDSNLKADDNGYAVLDENGNFQLVDPTKDGYYHTLQYCVNYGKTDDYGVTDAATKVGDQQVVLATKADYAIITSATGLADKTNILGYAVGENGTKIYNPTQVLPLENDKIELAKCTEPGSYTVTYYQGEGKPLSSYTVTVTKHHMATAPVAQFATKNDQDGTWVTYAKDGSVVVTSKTCIPVEYYEVIHCSAAGCPGTKCTEKYESTDVNGVNWSGHYEISKVKKTSGVSDHKLNTNAKNAIAKLVAEYGAKGTVKKESLTYAQLKAVATGKAYYISGTQKTYVELSDDPSDCENGGDVTVTYICIIDGKEIVETETVHVYPIGHDWGLPTQNIVKKPTCYATGSYDIIQVCKHDSSHVKYLDRDITIPRLAHTNELSVTSAGVGKDDIDDTLKAKTIGFDFDGTVVIDPRDGSYYYAFNGDTTYGNLLKNLNNYIGNGSRNYGVYVHAYSVCDTCLAAIAAGEYDGPAHTVQLTGGNGVTTGDADAKITITDISKQSSTGYAGSVTVKASYVQSATKTFTSDSYTADYYTDSLAYAARKDAESESGSVASGALYGLHLDADGVWKYYNGGAEGNYASSYTGWAELEGKKFAVVDGLVATDAYQLTLFEGGWYMMSAGMLRDDYTGVVYYDGVGFYVTKGVLDASITGLVEYDGASFYFTDGRMRKDLTGLTRIAIDGVYGWYYLIEGRVASELTQLVVYDGQIFYVEDGILQSDFTGFVEYDGATHYVENGWYRYTK